MTSFPIAGDFAPYFARYIDLVPTADVMSVLRGQIGETLATLRGVAFIIAGHEAHHMRIVRERYLA